MAKQIPTEHDEQAALVSWMRLKRILHAAVPNGFFTNGKRDKRFYGQIKKLKDEGYSPGFPDLMVFKDNDVLFLEMKRVAGGSVSDDQEKWLSDLEALNHKVAVCEGFDEAKQTVTDFINGDW